MSTKFNDQSIAEKLLELYPNRKTKGLSKDNKVFYNSIQRHAKSKNMTNKEYLVFLGFNTVNKTSNQKCNRCGNYLPENYDRKTCPDCRKSRSEKAKKSRETRLKTHSCTKCGAKLPDDTEHKYCESCREQGKKIVQKRRSKLISQGRCEDCGIMLPNDYTNRKCKKCISRYNIEPLYTEEIEAEIINVYNDDNRKKSDLCLVNDCDKKLYAKGLCNMHYKKARRLLGISET